MGGIEVYPEVRYFDVNDLADEIRARTRKFFSEDKSYSEYVKNHKHMYWVSGDKGKRYCVYVWRKGVNIGNIVFEEYFDQPDGYGEKDFMMTKFIYPEFRGTKYSRYTVCDITHVLFFANAARKIYAYASGTRAEGSLFEKIDTKAPCKGPHLSIDRNQPYLLYKKLIETEWKPFVLMEWDGEIYKSLNIYEHMLTPPGGMLKSEKAVREWVERLNVASEKVEMGLNAL